MVSMYRNDIFDLPHTNNNKAMQQSAYRQYILYNHGYLGSVGKLRSNGFQKWISELTSDLNHCACVLTSFPAFPGITK